MYLVPSEINELVGSMYMQLMHYYTGKSGDATC